MPLPPPSEIRRRWIDAHAHVVPDRVIEALRRNPKLYGIDVEGSDGRFTFTFGHRRIDQPTFCELVDGARFVERQRSRINRGLCGEVVSVWPELGSYDLPSAQGRAWARLYNEGLARFIQDQPAGLDVWGLGIVPLQDPEGAVQELEHVMGPCGLKGTLIVANPPNLRLEGKEMAPFWARAEALGATLFLHPNIGFAPGLDKPYFLGVVVGAPVDTTFSVASLIAAGVLDRHPKLKILLAHGGGFFPFQAGRFAFIARKDITGGRRLGYQCERPIDEYLSALYYDTLLYDPGVIRRLAEQVGTSQLLAGSDYPFPTYEVDTIDAIVATALPESAMEAMLYGNAVRLLNLTPRR